MELDRTILDLEKENQNLRKQTQRFEKMIHERRVVESTQGERGL
jgi:hypothetical protein